MTVEMYHNQIASLAQAIAAGALAAHAEIYKTPSLKVDHGHLTLQPVSNKS